ncbi:MAG TPA: hypothetical protein VHG91_03055 [Longimicrobium sp.]|nr:hypothetical protein [Longimicrobium sp.]
MSRGGAAAWGVVLLAACGGGADAPEREVARETGGVAAEWRLSAEPEVGIGAAEGDPRALLFQVEGAVRLDGGAIAVANAGTHEVRFYGRDGRFAAAYGRQGRGPGEFETLAWLGALRGDTVAAWDASLLRWTLLTPRGVVRTVAPRPAPPGMFPQARGVFADGSFVLASGWDVARMAAGGTGVRRDSVTLLRYGPDGTLLGPVARLPGRQEYVTTGASGFSTNPVPFGRETFVAVGDSLLYALDTGGARVDAFTPLGRRVPGMALDDRPAPVRAEDRERYRRVRLAAIEVESYRAEQEKVLAEIPFPETMPVFQDLRHDGAGHLWVGAYPAVSGAPREWTILAPGGERIATARTPAGLRVLQVGPDFVLGKATDEAGVERVRLYRLSRR